MSTQSGGLQFLGPRSSVCRSTGDRGTPQQEAPTQTFSCIHGTASDQEGCLPDWEERREAEEELKKQNNNQSNKIK